MAESIHDQIAGTMRAGLAAIRSDAGATYWYTPELVDYVSFYDELESGPEIVMLLRSGEEEHTEDESGDAAAGIGMLAHAEFFLMVAARFEPSGEQPGSQPDLARPRVVNRLVRDALRYLLLDIRLGGLAINVISGSLFVNRDFYHAKWAVAELRFVVEYTYRSGTP